MSVHSETHSKRRREYGSAAGYPGQFPRIGIDRGKVFQCRQTSVFDSSTMSRVDENRVANMTIEQMKPAPIESRIGLDRLATEKEVRCAVAHSSHGSFALCCASDGESDFTGYIGVFLDEPLWLALAREILDPKSN
jgi:hypothetical protein